MALAATPPERAPRPWSAAGRSAAWPSWPGPPASSSPPSASSGRRSWRRSSRGRGSPGPGNALSHLGTAGEPTAPLFNGSLVLGGVLGVVYVWRVGRSVRNAWHRVGLLLLGLGLASSSLVGVFNLPHPLHTPVALGYFVAFTLGLFAHGSGDALAGRPRRGIRSIWFAVAHVAGWVALAFAPFEGIALPELVGVLALWGWTIQTFLDLRGGQPAD